MDTNQWPQGIGVVRPTNIEAATKSGVGGGERKPRPQKEKVVNCPRCNSTNTKFCYYNNYSLSQPRYFCKTCRRYWTEGGTLRNVPVGGGSRKNRRSSTCSSSSLIKKLNSDLTPPSFSSQNPKIHDGQDLNLAYNPHKGNLGINYNGPNSYMPSTTNPSITFPSLSSLMSMPISESTSVFYSSALNPLHEIKPHNKFNFSIDGIENGYNYGSVQDHSVPVQDTTARLFLPYEELKTVSTTTRSDQYDDNDQQNIKGQGESAGFWNGMLGGGGSW